MYNPYQHIAQYQSPYGGFGSYMQPGAAQQLAPESLVWVSGIDGARAYATKMGPNSSAAVFDSNRDVFYTVMTDGAGFPTVKTYAFSELTEESAPAPEYVTRAEFEELKAMVAPKQEVSNG